VDLLIEPYGRRTVWPHPVDINHNPAIAPEAREEGAEHCLQYEDELARLEIIVKEFWDVRSTAAGLFMLICHSTCLDASTACSPMQ
jgi:hypothetical protein